MDKARNDGSNIQRGGFEGGGAGFDLHFDGICRFACVHASGPQYGTNGRRKVCHAGGGVAANLAQEGVHA